MVASLGWRSSSLWTSKLACLNSTSAETWLQPPGRAICGGINPSGHLPINPVTQKWNQVKGSIWVAWKMRSWDVWYVDVGRYAGVERRGWLYGCPYQLSIFLTPDTLTSFQSPKASFGWFRTNYSMDPADTSWCIMPLTLILPNIGAKEVNLDL